MPQNTYAVIGSNCFTGSHIVDHLLDDPSNVVIGISRSPEKSDLFLPYKRRRSANFEFFQVDLFRQPNQLISLLDQFKPSHIINVAALSEVGLSNFQPVEYFQTNCLGTVMLCNQLRSRNYLKRYVHISSAEVYGSCQTALHESTLLNPSTPYAVSKAAADMYLMTLHKNFAFPVILIRSTNVYGKHQQLYKIIPRSIIYLKKGEKLELHGGGVAVKTWIHIRDAVRGIVLAGALGTPGEIYHFSDSHSYSISDLVKKICELMGCDFHSNTISVAERLGQDPRYLLDYSKVQRELNWSPQFSFEDGLSETISWVEENWNQVTNESLVYVHQS